MADLRDNLFGERVWMSLDPAARTFVATGERLMRDHRRDPAFDFSAVLIELAKAVEVQVTATLASAIGSAPGPIRHAHVENSTVDLARRGGLSLGQLPRVISGERERFEWLVRNVEHGTWFTQQLPPMLERLTGFRNPAAHSERRDRDPAVRLRAEIVGIGCAGLLVELTKVQRKDERFPSNGRASHAETRRVRRRGSCRSLWQNRTATRNSSAFPAPPPRLRVGGIFFECFGLTDAVVDQSAAGAPFGFFT